MIRSTTVAFVALAVLVPPTSLALSSDEVEVARGLARRKQPVARWHPGLSVDINCDGVADRIFTGREGGRFHVAAILGPLSQDSQVSLLTFLLSGESPDAFCGPPTLLERERLDYDPTEALGATPPGFRHSSECFGLRLVAGECDAFHFYWDHTGNSLQWWRS